MNNNTLLSQRDPDLWDKTARGIDRDIIEMNEMRDMMDSAPCKSEVLVPVVQTILINGKEYPIDEGVVWVDGAAYRVVGWKDIHGELVGGTNISCGDNMPNLGNDAPKKQAKQPKPYAKFNTLKHRQRRS